MEEFCYQPLEKKDFSVAWDKHRDLVSTFFQKNKYDESLVSVSDDSILSIIVKVDQRKKYFKYFHKLNMSEYKEAALNCFWYIKLKPIGVKSPDLLNEETRDRYNELNEKLALYIILTTLRAMLNKNKLSTKKLDGLPKKYLDELVYTFTYRDISKEMMIILVESMAIFLGLDPYANQE